MSISPEIDALILHFYNETTGPFWPVEREIVEGGYRMIAFPFEEIVAPEIVMEAEWTLAQVLGYLRTWSATQKFIAARGFDPVEAVGEGMLGHWGAEGSTRVVRWPLHIRLGRRA